MEKYVTRLLTVDHLIRRKATGTPKELAERLHVSESTVYRILRVMKGNMRLEIEFSERRRSYIYKNENEKLSFENLALAMLE